MARDSPQKARYARATAYWIKPFDGHDGSSLSVTLRYARSAQPFNATHELLLIISKIDSTQAIFYIRLLDFARSFSTAGFSDHQLIYINRSFIPTELANRVWTFGKIDQPQLTLDRPIKLIGDRKNDPES